DHHGIRTDLHIRADADGANDLGTGTDDHAIAQNGRTWTAADPDGHLLSDDAVISDHRVLVNDHAVRMWQREMRAHSRGERDVDSAEHTPDALPEREPGSLDTANHREGSASVSVDGATTLAAQSSINDTRCLRAGVARIDGRSRSGCGTALPPRRARHLS